MELLEQKADLKRTTHNVEEAHLNYQEMYKIVAEEAFEAMRMQKALERIITHMEAEHLPLKIKNKELANALQQKEAANELLEKSLQEIQEDRQAISTLLSLSLASAIRDESPGQQSTRNPSATCKYKLSRKL